MSVDVEGASPLEAALAEVDRDLVRLGISVLHRREVARTVRVFFRERPGAVESVRREDVVAYLAARRLSSVAARTQAGDLTRLRCFYVALVRLGRVADDPTAGLSVAIPASGPHRLVSQDEVERLFAAALDPDPEHRGYFEGQAKKARPDLGTQDLEAFLRAGALRDRAALELLYGLGLRASELCAARLVDLDLGDGTLLVRRAKRGQPERLPLPPAAVDRLRAWLDARPLLARGEDQGRVIVRNDGRPLTSSGVSKLLARVAKRAGVSVHPHALRRGLATHLVRGGAPIAVVQRLLGHASLSTTAIYVEVERGDLRRAVAFLEHGEARSARPSCSGAPREPRSRS